MRVTISQQAATQDIDHQDQEVKQVPDGRLFTFVRYEKRHSWLYYSAAKGAYCCKICELFSPILDNCQINPYVAGVTLGTHPSRKLCKHEISKIFGRSWDS